MSKVIAFNLPAHGHINPSLAVIQELVARGEQVIYYITEEFRAKIEATGATVRCYPLSNPQLPKSFSLLGIELGLFPQLLDEVQAEKPDYILYDWMCLSGKLIAQILNIQAIALYSTYASNEQFLLFSAFNPNSLPMRMQGMKALTEKEIQQICTTYSIHPFDFFHPTADDIESLNIVFIPRDLQPQAQTFDERFVFVGPSIQPRPESTNFSLEQISQPTLYISLGTTMLNDWLDFYQMCFAAFAGKPWRVVMAIGNKVDPNQLGVMPGNFIVAPHVPQLTVLQQADVFLTHSGMNSVMESLYYGVPMVAIPQMPEQQLTAKRIAELNLGIALEKSEVTVNLLQSSVNRVFSEPQFAHCTGQMQQLLQQTGGYKQAADEILQFISKSTRR